MKKGLKILTVSLLFSSAIFSTPAVNAVVHAEEIGETTVDERVDNDEIRGRLLTLIAEAKSVISSESYTEASLESVKALLPSAEKALEDLENNLAGNYEEIVLSLKNALDNLIEITESSSSEPEPSTTDSSSTMPESTDSSSTIPSSTDSSSTAPSSTDSSSTIPSSTDSSSTIPSSTDSDVTVPTSTDLSSTDEAKPTIEITDQTMYVGQSLTEEMILSWATFHNADGYEVGFEILESPIKVTAIGNTLLEVGTYKIRYYISQLTRMATNVVAEKTITLTILSESENPINQVTSLEKNKNPKAPTNNILSPVANPVSTKNQKSITSAQTKAKQLPETGEVNNGMTIASAGVILIAGAYIFRKKQLDK
ncbi:LPXTG cell wall anchor domain-containing protein [Enterococcus plantarum]|uniref:LPXTG cell wall anchor domain-containing protein n=1 Tax=Enterococcus plantarum TaxID=1077675 RepID=UPI001A906AE2|nr:LPXTG cell wall anchor domain-containing protein [Enterococcus plantarum]MBO0467343.1 LPXTG cell wall anchor domain-containing protein [Enterococcus plantarum]